jgi:FixJ family two-component response regulator
MDSPSIVIAVVENDHSTLRALQRLLAQRGYSVELFHSGEEFLDAAAVSRAACAVIDVHLGAGVSGFDLAREISAQPQPIPFLLMSASLDASFPRRAAGLGCVAFLEKPFADGELFAALDRALGRNPDRRCAADRP